MEPASIIQLRRELQLQSHDHLVELILRLARHKKENKELLSFLLFDEQDLDQFLTLCKEDLLRKFQDINGKTIYIATKGLRKILRYTNKLVRFTGDKRAEAELHSYYCRCLMDTGLPIHKSLTLNNMMDKELRKIELASAKLHPDLQHDFTKEINAIKEELKQV